MLIDKTTFQVRMLVLLPLLLASPLAIATKMPNRKLPKNNFLFGGGLFIPTTDLTGMEPLQTQMTLLATLKTHPSNVLTSTATNQLLGMTARLKVFHPVLAEYVFDRVFYRRRCVGTGQKANVSPGARRSASR